MRKISSSLKRYLLPNNRFYFIEKRGKLLTLFAVFLLYRTLNAQRIGNCVNNGSFEKLYDCTTNSLLKAKYWTGIDSLCYGGLLRSECNGQVPSNFGTYQYPHSGQSYITSGFYYVINSIYQRTYSKNRLKLMLKTGKTYCVKFYVNITNSSSYGMDGFGAYFGDNSIDTINYCNVPLSYLTPQVQNPQGNIITDTLNWVAITGTFTANGTEKFLLLGNFLANNAVDTLMMNPTSLPTKYTNVNIDDVSCIEVNLPAYAGRDTTIYTGDSTYIGREPDFAIDSGCVWYQLPNTITSIARMSGIWVKPNGPGTYTYVVRQHLECSALKWDTVVVTVRNFDVGIKENNTDNWLVDLFPNPAGSTVTFKSIAAKEEMTVRIFDMTGREVLSKQLRIDGNVSVLDLDLSNGAYLTSLTNTNGSVLIKKLLVAK
jgi:hypothetical protein